MTPDPVYARRLAGVIGAVDGARRRARAQMARSSGRALLSGQARALAGRFQLGASTLARLETPPVAGVAQVLLARAMIAAADAYRRLGGAVRSGTPASFARARARVGATEERVNRALENFALLGYGRS